MIKQQSKQMMQYPLTNISKQEWNKYVTATYMYSIPLEDEALPILERLVDLLEHLHIDPIQNVIAEEHLQYFLTQVFPPACQKILKSRYFKSSKILQLANKILELSVNLVVRYVQYAQKWQGFAQTIMIVYSTDQYYYKTNNQFHDCRSFAHQFVKQADKKWVQDLKEGDFVDVLKVSHLSNKATWSRGKVLSFKPTKIKIQYSHDYYDETISLDKGSYMLAPFKSKSNNFDWRMQLKEGDLVDCQDHYGGWYSCTIMEVMEKDEDKKMVKVTFKVYDEKGNKFDEKGRYYGLSGYTQEIDATSPKIQPFGSVIKDRNYYDTGSKSFMDSDDLNDEEFQDLCGQKLYALPRKKCLSQFLFNAINNFGRMGGFNKPIDRLEKSLNLIFLCNYVKGISGIAQCLNKALVKDLVDRLKPIIQAHIFTDNEQFLKDFNKDRSEMLFSGFKTLQRRIMSMEAVYEYENDKKMRLVDRCLQSQALKRKLQGLNELKDIVKSVTYGSERNKFIKNWIKEQNLFEKIYLINSHVQLIKKSEDFFRYLINESILEVNDLQRLYKIAQKGDYESRISLYKLFQDVSHIFKKPHVDFLIDSILESDLSLILNEDIDLLNEMSKFSNYFPKDKVRSFFESIILGDIQHESLYEYATKKYSEIVAKGYEMKSCRRDIIHSFMSKLTTHNISQVAKVLKGIFEGIGIGEYGKKDLNEILADENIDEVVTEAIRNNKDKLNENIVSEVLGLLGFIYKLSYKVKVLISTLKGIWNEMKNNQKNKKQYYKWVNSLIGCEQGIGQSNEIDQFEDFVTELFPRQDLHNVSLEEFHLLKNLLVEINKKNKFLIPTYLTKEIEYKRKVQMHELKLSDYFMYIINNISDPQIYQKGLSLFLEIYNAKDNEIEDIHTLFASVLEEFYKNKKDADYTKVTKSLKLINILIDNSEKRNCLEIQSLVTKEKSEVINVIIINDIVYVNQYSKKKELTVPLNMTLFEFKKLLTQHYNLEVDQVKLSQERQIPEYYNSRTLKELPVNLNDPLSLSKRYVNNYYQPEIVINNKMNPKAVRCFKVIFDRYSVDGVMNKEQAHQFTSACLSSISKRYDDKVNFLFSHYDHDNDGLLNFEGFLGFYEDAAKDNRTGTVWSNLKSFGVNPDFRFPYQSSKTVNEELFPRKILSDSPQFYESLFDLLSIQDIAPIAFHLLQRLPISKKIYHEVLGIGKVTTKAELDIQNIFKFDNHYNYFYRLTIISYLRQSELEEEKNWLKIFIESEAVELVYTNLKEFMNVYDKTSQNQDIEIDIINYQIKLLFEYFLRCFTEKFKIQALELLQTDVDLDDKIQFLVTGCFPKTQQKLIEITATKIYEWKGQPVKELCKTFISFLRKIWIEWGDTIEKEHAKLFTFNKVISIICFLQVDEDPTFLVEQFEIFFSKPPSNRLLRSFYCLIVNICFYSVDNQSIYISEMFQHITKTNITSDYFRILAVLVAKFGMEEEKVCEMPEILLNNILKEKNELTIQGCAKLLSNFHLSKEIAEREIEVLWDNCLFGLETSCRKEQTRQALYDLILKICENSKEATDIIIKKTLETMNKKFKQIKITYSTEVNQRSTTGYSGMKNLGNTCYINSMMQQLYMNKTFRYLVMRINDGKQPVFTVDPKGNQVDDNILHQTQRTFGYLERTTRLDFIPTAFCVAYKPFGESVNIMIQQDVQEFVSMFFDRLESGIKDHPLRRLIDNFYHGKNANLFSCHECNQTKKVEESFYSITLEVKNSKNLAESFNRYILGELISDYKCDFCNKKADVSKKTRISKLPHNLLIHLQRIDLNFETFVNEKLTNKHQFPMSINMYPYTMDYYDREQLNDANLTKEHPEFQYELTGIICHIGNAEQGHYISYIKNSEGKWFEFNDGMINTFNSSNIESQCFGGSFTYDDEYDWEKRENSKSAYILVYQNTSENLIEMEVSTLEEKNTLLQTLNLNEDNREETVKVVSQEEPTESQEDGSSHVEDSEKEREKMKIQMEQIEMIRKHKSEDNIDVQVNKKMMEDEKWEKAEKTEKSGKKIIKVKDSVDIYIQPNLQKQIEADNELHFFEKCLASTSFSKFFAKLLMLPQNNSKQMITLCQKLTFGFWLKSQSFKELLNSLNHFIKTYPEGLRQVLTENTNLVTLLIQNSELEVRTNIASFLANSFTYYIEYKNLTLDNEDLDEDNQMIILFLDNLFSLIPTKVSKCWTKFNQYFEFWYEFSKKNEAAGRYMVRKQVVKHFIDYFLDKKSPLKIYKDRPQIGSSYANPNFGMLLKTIESMIEFYLSHNIELSPQQKVILIHFNFIEKLIHDGYETIAAKIVKIICPNNIYASEKIAIVLLKGISKSNFENIQPYLDVVHEYILIDDEHQMCRIKWVLGKQTLLVSTVSKTLSAMNAYSLEDRIYQFNSAITLESGSSLLEPLFVNNRRTENFCIICLQELMKLCHECQIVRNYVWSLGPPNYLFGKYTDFFEEFITRYIDEAKRIYGYSTSTSFNREQLGKNVRQLHQECLQMVKESQPKVDDGQMIVEKEEEVTDKMEAEEPAAPLEEKEEEKPEIQEKPEEKSEVKAEEQPEKKEKEKVEGKVEEDFDFNIQGSGPAEEDDETQRLASLARNPSSQNSEGMIDLQKKPSDDSDKKYGYTMQDLCGVDEEDYSEVVRDINQGEEIKIKIEGVNNWGKGRTYRDSKKKKIDSDKENNYSSGDEHLLEEEHWESGSRNRMKYEEEGQSPTSPIKDNFFEESKKPVDESEDEKYYHPVRFNFKAVEELESGKDNVKIEQHASEVILVRTYPTGITNKAFTSTYSHKKVSERLDEKVWENKKVMHVKGYFVSNNSKQTIRLQTNDGSVYIRSLEGGWVWAEEIMRIWVPERFNQWPEWSLYTSSQEPAQTNEIPEAPYMQMAEHDNSQDFM